jgi:two-component system, LytTR family, response regulator
MNRLRILVIDDEPLGRRAVRQLLLAHNDCEVVGEARNGREAIRLIRDLKPELVFLDVQMPENDGFGVLRALAPMALPWVIFVTAYDTFAVRAFEANALDYLVKPLHEGRFKDALCRVRERSRSKEAIELSKRLSALLATENISSEPQSDPVRRLLVGTGEGAIILNMSDVDWISAEDYYVAIHSGGHKYLVRESLSSLETRLDDSQFLRVHRKVIVNLAQIHKAVSHFEEGSFLVLRNGDKVPVSRRLRPRVASALRRLRE